MRFETQSIFPCALTNRAPINGFHNIYKNNDFYYFHVSLYLFHMLQHVCGHIAILALSEPDFLFLCVSSTNCKTDALALEVLNKNRAVIPMLCADRFFV